MRKMMNDENGSVKDLLLEFFKINNIEMIKGCAGMLHLLIEQAYHSKYGIDKKGFMEWIADVWDKYDKLQKDRKVEKEHE